MPKARPELAWLDELPCSITVCDRDYKILYMNKAAAKAHKADGGMALIGSNLMDCHPSKAQKKVREEMLSAKPNVYTIERKGVKKQVYHGQWKKNGRIAGLVELSFEIPWDMPHHKRDQVQGNSSG
jgi:transcriptional regulator with PAS, ATPase and Fis domain